MLNNSEKLGLAVKEVKAGFVKLGRIISNPKKAINADDLYYHLEELHYKFKQVADCLEFWIESGKANFRGEIFKMTCCEEKLGNVILDFNTQLDQVVKVVLDNDENCDRRFINRKLDVLEKSFQRYHTKIMDLMDSKFEESFKDRANMQEFDTTLSDSKIIQCFAMADYLTRAGSNRVFRPGIKMWIGELVELASKHFSGERAIEFASIRIEDLSCMNKAVDNIIKVIDEYNDPHIEKLTNYNVFDGRSIEAAYKLSEIFSKNDEAFFRELFDVEVYLKILTIVEILHQHSKSIRMGCKLKNWCYEELLSLLDDLERLGVLKKLNIQHTQKIKKQKILK